MIRWMRTARVYSAGVILGLTVAAAVWIYTYRTWNIVAYVKNVDGNRHHVAIDRARIQPWWGVPATVGVLLIGGAISLWVLPQGRDLIRRYAQRLGSPSREVRDPRPDPS
jgi:hypothetical protein